MQNFGGETGEGGGRDHLEDLDTAYIYFCVRSFLL